MLFLLGSNLCFITKFSLHDRGSQTRLYFQTQHEDVPLSVLPLSGSTWYCNACIKLGGVWSKAICWLCVFIQWFKIPHKNLGSKTTNHLFFFFYITKKVVTFTVKANAFKFFFFLHFCILMVHWLIIQQMLFFTRPIDVCFGSVSDPCACVLVTVISTLNSTHFTVVGSSKVTKIHSVANKSLVQKDKIVLLPLIRSIFFNLGEDMWFKLIFFTIT